MKCHETNIFEGATKLDNRVIRDQLEYIWKGSNWLNKLDGSMLDNKSEHMG